MSESRVILLSAGVTPIRVAFHLEGDAWNVMEYMTDLVFLMDIVFTFRTAYYNAEE